MPKNNTSAIGMLLLLAFMLILFSCKKNPFDYRSKYEGEWDFNVVNSTKIVTIDSVVEYKEYQYQGTIKASKGDHDLVITYSSWEEPLLLAVNKDGELENGLGTISKSKAHIYISNVSYSSEWKWVTEKTIYGTKK